MALQGSLDTFALPDVLRLLAATAKTGRLRIEGDRGHGSVWLRDGTVMAATADRVVEDAPAEEVLFELLRFEEGSFAFDMDELSPSGEQPEDVEILLRNAGALLSEWNELVGIVPSLDHRVKLVASLPKGDVTIDSRRWPSLVAVASGGTVRDVASTLGLSELGATRAVRDLVDLGVAQVDAAEQRSSEDTIPPATRRDVPPDEMARRTPFSSLGSGETLATAVPRSDTDGLPRASWLQSPERSPGGPGGVPDALSPTASGGRGSGSPRNGASSTTPPAGTEVPPRLGRSASSGPSATTGPSTPSGTGTSGTSGSGRRSGSGTGSGRSGSSTGSGRSASGTGSGRSAGSGRSSGSRASGSSRSSSSRAPGSGRSSGSGRRAGRSGTGAASSGAGRDASGESRRPPMPGTPGGPGSANGEGPSRPGKTRPPSAPRHTGGPSRPPVLPDTGPLSMPPVSPTPFETGPLGPPPLPADTGQIRPVPSSALPPDLQWAVDDDAGMAPPPGPYSNGIGHAVGNGMGNGVGNGVGNGMGNGVGNGRLGGPRMGPGAGGGAPLDPNKVAPHVAAMSPEARAAVQGTVGNTGGAATGLGPGDELAQRGQLLSFLSSVRP